MSSETYLYHDVREFIGGLFHGMVISPNEIHEQWDSLLAVIGQEAGIGTAMVTTANPLLVADYYVLGPKSTEKFNAVKHWAEERRRRAEKED